MHPDVLRLLDAGLVQPDRWSCGAQSTLMAAVVLGAIPPPTATQHSATVSALHRELVSSHSPRSGRPQLPWPRRLGTPPWAVARALTQKTGRRHRVRWTPWWNRARRYDELVRAVRHGSPVPVYVGTGLLPRHVVLAVRAADVTSVHDPADGRLHPLRAADWCAGRLSPSASWPLTWWIVLPDQDSAQSAA